MKIKISKERYVLLDSCLSLSLTWSGIYLCLNRTKWGRSDIRCEHTVSM